MRIEARHRLIVALDVPPYDPKDPSRLIETSDARQIVDQLEGIVSFVKIGWPLYMAGHQELVKEFLKLEKKVFLDLKFGDIAETVKRLVLVAARDGVSFLTLNTSFDGVRAAVRARGQSDLKILAVTLLTSLDERDLREMSFQKSVREFVLEKAQQARDVGGADGVIASGKEVAAIRERLGDDFLIVTPGIRLGGAAPQDHKRAVTPTEAIHAGADYLVVGRPITQARNPRDAAMKIVEEMQKAFDSPSA